MAMAKASPRQCPRCGNTLLPHQRFCARCGELVSESAQQAEQRKGVSMAGAPVEVAQEDFPEPQEIPSTPGVLDDPDSVGSGYREEGEEGESEEAIEDRPTTTFQRPDVQSEEGKEAIEDRPTTTFQRPDVREEAIEARPTALFRKSGEENEQGREGNGVNLGAAGGQDTIISQPGSRRDEAVQPVAQNGNVESGVGREWSRMSVRERARNRDKGVGGENQMDMRNQAMAEQMVEEPVKPTVSDRRPISDGVVLQRGVSQPGISQPGISQPGISQPGISQPGISQPGISQPGISQPGISQPGINEMGARNPVSSFPGIAGVVGQGSYASNAVSNPGIEQRPASDRGAGGEARAGVPARRRRNLIGVLAAVVVIVVLLGVAGYLLLPGLTNRPKPVTQPPITRANIDSTANYAGVDVTIVNTQQTQRFIHSADSNTNGVVRLTVRAHNASDQAVNFDYHKLAHLILPGGKEEQPILVDALPTIAANATQAGTLDFAVPTSVKASQLIFRLGDASKVQIDIPLNGQANLSRYQPQTSTMSQQVSYLNLSWTVSQITTQNSLNNQQANKGTRYITLTIKVTNNAGQTVITGSPYDYLTMQVGGKALQPVYSTMPTSFDADASGVSGTVTFQVASSAGKGTLTWSSTSATGFDQANTDLSFPS
jgi:hypothetical protein